MRPDLAILIALVGVFCIVVGIGWMRGDHGSRLSRVAISFTNSSYSMPRDAVYGFVPAGVAVVLIAAGMLLSHRASIIALYVAMPIAGIAIAFTWHPPEAMKPGWVRAEEAIGKRSKRMDAWDRGLTVLAAIGLVVTAVVFTILIVEGPPASLGF